MCEGLKAAACMRHSQEQSIVCLVSTVGVIVTAMLSSSSDSIGLSVNSRRIADSAGTRTAKSVLSASPRTCKTLFLPLSKLDGSARTSASCFGA